MLHSDCSIGVDLMDMVMGMGVHGMNGWEKVKSMGWVTANFLSIVRGG